MKKGMIKLLKVIDVVRLLVIVFFVGLVIVDFKGLVSNEQRVYLYAGVSVSLMVLTVVSKKMVGISKNK